MRHLLLAALALAACSSDPSLPPPDAGSPVDRPQVVDLGALDAGSDAGVDAGAVLIDDPPATVDRPEPVDAGADVVDAGADAARACNRDEDCPTGEVCSVSTCVNLQTDPNNCGVRTVVCDLPHTATHVCRAGSCDVGTCDVGWGDCNSAPGCEADITSSYPNCGACGNSCLSTQRCVDGACRF